jgi:hypothetical protein
MPNWCDNRLVVTGEDSVLDEFTEAIRVDDMHYSILDRLLPFPPGLVGEEIYAPNGSSFRTFSDRGYNWCLANWGCKWSDKDTLMMENNEGERVFYLTTPWGPPDKAIVNISKTFPSLTFVLMYHEDGMRFAGGMAVRGGSFLAEFDDDSLVPDYNDDDEQWTEALEEMYLIMRRRLEYGISYTLA